MAVILSNARLAVARKEHAWRRDPQGRPVAAPVELDEGAYQPGSVVERADVGAESGVEFGLRLDPSQWPVRQGDHVHELAGARVWTVVQASLKTVVGYSDVDHVSATAVLVIPATP